MTFAASYGGYLPNLIDRENAAFTLLKMKQLRFVYLEGFIFYASQHLEGSPKQMQLSYLFLFFLQFVSVSDDSG